ncbi:MAG: 2,3-bisphosphoglycerate-independent phosphoglycerate mutase [Deltaproteobacteria bacterium]|nr:2,3-bisphosphoglycerate-independent phosphoglycerate mutase [Deltaproteobacteria bacterium]
MLFKDLLNDGTGKIVMLVFDGLGGVPHPDTGQTELEAATVPNLDSIASRSACGLMNMVDYGITPGSGPGHMALFGYDPTGVEVGRGVLEALGVGHTQADDELSARGNFATMDPDSRRITDRRGGPPNQDRNIELVARLNNLVTVPGYEVKFLSGKEHRFVFILKGADLDDSLSETDPQVTGVPSPPVEAQDPAAAGAADAVNRAITAINEALVEFGPQNTVLLRGFAKVPDVEPFPARYGLKSAAIATYPMYKGIASLVGMDVLDTGPSFPDQVAALKAEWDRYDFFFVHVKGTDGYGHKGDFDGKVRVLSECDRLIPEIESQDPAVLIVTGDHSTPTALKDHSFHPVPVLVRADTAIPTGNQHFTEADCAGGILGVFPGSKLMQLALAYAGRLKKFGA